MESVSGRPEYFRHGRRPAGATLAVLLDPDAEKIMDV